MPARQWSQGARLRTVDEELPEAPSGALDAQQQQQQQQADAQAGQDVPEGATYERPMSRESAGSSDGSGPSDSAQSMHTQLGSLPKVSRGRGGCSGCVHGQWLPCTTQKLCLVSIHNRWAWHTMPQLRCVFRLLLDALNLCPRAALRRCRLASFTAPPSTTGHRCAGQFWLEAGMGTSAATNCLLSGFVVPALLWMWQSHWPLMSECKVPSGRATRAQPAELPGQLVAAAHSPALLSCCISSLSDRH